MSKVDYIITRLREASRNHAERVLMEEAATMIERSRARDLEWQEKAATWLASPEAAQRLAGYRELGALAASALNEADDLRPDADRWRYLLAADSPTVCACEDGEWIPVHPKNIAAVIDAAMQQEAQR